MRKISLFCVMIVIAVILGIFIRTNNESSNNNVKDTSSSVSEKAENSEDNVSASAVSAAEESDEKESKISVDPSTFTGWKKAYYDRLEKIKQNLIEQYPSREDYYDMSPFYKFDLYDIDNDGVPELFVSKIGNVASCDCYTYFEGDIKKLDINSYGTYHFRSDLGLIQYRNEGMSTYNLNIFKKENNNIEKVLSLVDTSSASSSDYLEPEYYINDEKVSVEKYVPLKIKYENLSWETVGRKYKFKENEIISALDSYDKKKDQTWQELYTEKLQSLNASEEDSNKVLRFDIYDLDKNGIPELIINDYQKNNIFTVFEGRVIPCCNLEEIDLSFNKERGLIIASSDSSFKKSLTAYKTEDLSLEPEITISRYMFNSLIPERYIIDYVETDEETYKEKFAEYESLETVEIGNRYYKITEENIKAAISDFENS